MHDFFELLPYTLALYCANITITHICLLTFLCLQQTLISSINFQVWIYEGSPYIEFHYGPSDFQSELDSLSDFENSIIAPLIATYYNLENDEVEMWVLEGSMENPVIRKTNFIDTNGDETDIVGLDDYPTDGTVYRFYLGASVAKEFWANLSDITIQSNMTSEYIRLVSSDLNHDKNINVVITDINGKVVSTGNFRAFDQIDVRSLSTGQYFVKVQEKGKSPKVLRFVKI
ncbi:MAG: T9SS type A sorting domain-containing protein [Saprospiraceae bacterium]|nr:T9SS type A sorting domain-containing protein [Saprospiraceae bacterium]